MIHLDACPLCSNADLEAIHRGNNLVEPASRGEVPAEWAVSDFAFCDRCGLIAARSRQDSEKALDFYDRFKELEHRDYVVYPPPKRFIESQQTLARGLFETARQHTARLDAPKILNLRSECGIVLDEFRQQLKTDRVYALDHFETNLRWASQDLGLPHVGTLLPGTPVLPVGWPQTYDLILANHLLTHALDLKGCMETLKTMLAPGGLLLFYNEADHQEALQTRTTYKRGINSFHKQLFSRKSLANLFRVSGLEFEPLAPIPGTKWAVPHAAMVVACTAGTTRELVGEHDDYRRVFKDWERRQGAWKPSLASRVKRGVKAMLSPRP